MHPPFAKRALLAGGFALLFALSVWRDPPHLSVTLITVYLPLQLLSEPGITHAETSAAGRSIVLALIAGIAGFGLLLFFRMLRKREALNLLAKFGDGAAGNDGKAIAVTDFGGKIITYNTALQNVFRKQGGNLMGENLLHLLTTSVSDGHYYLLRVDDKDGSDIANSVLFNHSDAPAVLGVRSEDFSGIFGRFRIFLFNTFADRGSREDWTEGMALMKCGFYNFAPVIFVSLNSDGEVLMVNEYFEGILQMSQRQIVGRKWFDDFVPEDRREYCLAIFQQCLSSGEDHYFESVISDSLGRKRAIYWKCGVMTLGNRKLVLYFGQDITEQEAEHIQLASSVDSLNRLTEELENRVRQRTSDLEVINMNLQMQIEERTEIEKQLVASERLHMAMAHNFPNGMIAVVDQNLRFVLVDGKELPSLGYSSAQLTGKSFLEEFGLDAGALDSLRRAFEGETTLYEVRFKEMYYNLTAVPLADSEDLVEKILVVFQNISQRKKLEESLYSSIDQERKLNELKSRFVTMASHEFRTPLSTILSSVFLMESYSGEMYEQKKQSHINRIKRTVNALAESLNDFLRLGKLEEGRVELILTETAVDEYMNEIVKEIQTIMRPGQQIRYVHHGINLNVLLDRNLTRGILLNLLSNAGKYSPENAEVYFNTYLSPSELVMKVTDKGLGIPQEEREHIFDRFFRAVNALHIEGTGLGLHIVKKYVELMNGTIDFTSGEEGTTFTVTIPLQYTQDNVRLILR